MPNAKEIKSRMSSVRDTQKITNAMYLIASTKLQKARRELENTKPFFNELRSEIKRIFRVKSDIESRYFYPQGTDELHTGKYGILVVTADKGLAGAYNQNVLKMTEKLIKEHPDYELYVVGEYGRQYFNSHNIPIERSFLYTAQNPTLGRAREIAGILIEAFLSGNLDKIYLVYTDMKNSMEADAKWTRLLPFHQTAFMGTAPEKKVEKPFEFNPSLEMVLENVMPSMVAGYIYSALVDSFCAEQNARMTAMDSANRNAEKLLAELTIEYNRVRQAAITQEITEVSAGAKAQKKKKAKKLALIAAKMKEKKVEL